MTTASALQTELEQVLTGRGGPVRHGAHTYYQDFGSMLSDVDRSVTSVAYDMLDWHRDHAKGVWSWRVEDRNAYNCTGKIVDVRLWLVLSFDLSADAMLSRMTWPDLKRYPDVERRRRTGKAS